MDYSYDAAQRLINAGTDSFDYDIAGNNQNDNATFTSNNRLIADNSYSYSYSPTGNLSQKLSKIDNSRKVYTWNSRNLLLKVESYDNQNQLTQTLSFTYGPLGRRLSKTINNQPVYYLYDNQDIVAILDETQQVVSTLIHAEYIDTPLSITTYEKTYYYHRDHLGSIVSLSNASQIEVENYSYDAYGLTERTQTEVTNNPYAYTGREYDDSDLYYYRARYYDPSIQRFLSEDPIGFLSGDYNFYRYVRNDPVNFVDPEGLSPAGWIIRLTRTGMRKISPVRDVASAQRARRQGQNVLARDRQTARQIERGANGGIDTLRHRGHDLGDGNTGRPHYQTNGRYGHTFWQAALGFGLSLLDPFDAISGELANGELNGREGTFDWTPYMVDPCQN